MLPCYKSVKLVLDKIAAAALLLLLTPVLFILAVLVLIDQKSVFFRHRRPGLLGEPFYMLKFKTMKDEDGTLTKLGLWMRNYSLDELPQLWNVLRGEMSLIGPRPYLMEYLDKYSDEHRKRHWVLPGITGWAQVNGADDLEWNTKLDYDVYYVDHISIWFDIKIMLKTCQLLVSGKRTDQPDTKFRGYSKTISNS